MPHSTALPTAIGILRHKYPDWRCLDFHDPRRGLSGAFLSVFVSRKHA